MTGKGMTSVSVSKSTRRQLNMLRAAGSYRSVDELLKDLIREHRLAKMRGSLDHLRSRVPGLDSLDLESLVDRFDRTDLAEPVVR